MKVKERHKITRSELPGRLRQVADMMEAGNLCLGETEVQMPDEVEYEIEYEEEKGRSKLEIEVSWHAGELGPANATEREESSEEPPIEDSEPQSL